jgi:HlyD family secretion protein/adhesin transport system membrane fusion protein
MRRLWPFTTPRNRPPASRDARLLNFLSQPLLVEEHGAPDFFRHLPWITGLFLGGCVALAAMTEVPETAMVLGQVVPAGSVQLVQHLEGGIIVSVEVTEGELVEADQTLIRLSPAEAASQLNETRSLEASLALQAERLQAFALDREPDFTGFEAYAHLIADQRTILETQRQGRETQRQVLQSRIRQRQAQLTALSKQRKHLDDQVAIVKQLVEMRANLVKQGLVSRISYLDTLRTYSQAREDLVGVLGQISKAQEDLDEAQDSLFELDARLRNEAQTERGKVASELARVREQLGKLNDRVSRLEVRSPARGLVKGLLRNGAGAVIRPGEPILEIVPVDDTLIAEVRIMPRDVGHLQIGQRVRVKPTAYDTAMLGSIDGRLDHVSATTFVDDRGQAFYKAKIALDRAYAGSDPAHHPILPGMEVTGDIITGRRTLLRYLLKPIYRAFEDAFHER